jgi:Peptidase family M28
MNSSAGGRRAGSAGHDRAAQYVAEQFRQLRLAPGAARGYLDRVDLIERRIDETRSSLALVERGELLPLTLGDDAIFNLRSLPAARIDAPLVFAGYGLRIPAFGIDDLQGLDLQGKIVVAFLAAPTGIPGAVQAHVAPRRVEPFMTLADASFDEFGGQKLWITLNPARADKLFEGAPLTYAAILALLEAGRPLPRFDLRRGLHAEVTAGSEQRSADNVVGVLPGMDKRLRGDCVVVSAHLDHLGIATAPGEDRIFNGAMDNAAGVAVLIEVARRMSAADRRTRRSIVFLTPTAEEMGHLGSRVYANRVATGAMRAVANVNSDLFLPLFPLRQLIVFGLEESDLGVDVRAVAAPLGIEVQADPEPLRNRFIRSDQYSFARLGIPAVALKTGFAPGSLEQQIERQWFAQRYHAVSDDLSQPVDLTAVGDFVELMTGLLIRVANRETAPAWNADSFFATLAPGSSRRHE